jgi:hypothetical protein
MARRLGPLAVGLASAAIVILVFGLLMRGHATLTLGDGVGGANEAAATLPFDPGADGSGLSGPPSDSPVVIVLVVAGLAALIAIVRLSSPRRRQVVAGLAGIAIATTFLLRTSSFVAWTDGSSAPGRGFAPLEAGDPSDAPQYFPVGPGEVFTYGFDVTNVGPFPLALLGVRDAEGGSWLVGSSDTSSSVAGGSLQVNAAGLLRDEGVISLDDRDTRPFRRIQIAPQEKRFLILAIRAGHCALGRDNRGDPSQSSDSFERIGVVYSVLGFEALSIVTLPRPLFVPSRTDLCDPLAEPSS